MGIIQIPTEDNTISSIELELYVKESIAGCQSIMAEINSSGLMSVLNISIEQILFGFIFFFVKICISRD